MFGNLGGAKSIHHKGGNNSITESNSMVNSNERTNQAFQTKVSFSVTFDLEAVSPISTLIVNVLLLEYLRVLGVSSALKVLKND